MGVDFIERIRRPLERSWNRGVSALKTPDLLTPVIATRARTVTLAVMGGQSLCADDSVVLEVDAGRLRGSVRGAVVGFVDDPPAEVRQFVEAAGNIALATVVRIGTFGDHAEICLEEVG